MGKEWTNCSNMTTKWSSCANVTTKWSKPYIIAEVGANHCQVYQKAVALVFAAFRAGAQAVKVQMYTPDSMTLDSDDERFQIKEGLWAGQSLYDLYKKACMPYEWIPKLKGIAEHLGLDFIVTVYDLPDVALAEEMGVQIYKIASFESDYLELIDRVAKCGKPMIISIGGLDYREVRKAYLAARNHLPKKKIALLKTCSGYPAKIEDVNLATLWDLTRTYGCIGISDHTVGITVPIASITYGAMLIEKHIKLDGGLDAAFSLNPTEFKQMVQAVNIAHKAKGKVVYKKDTKFHRVEINGRKVRVAC